jgi:hypothetical protein
MRAAVLVGQGPDRLTEVDLNDLLSDDEARRPCPFAGTVPALKRCWDRLQCETLA